MREIMLKIGNIWSLLTLILITAMICGTAIFIAMQYNKTQWDIAQSRVNSSKYSADKISSGLSKIGVGICRTGDNSVFSPCGY